MNSNRKGRCQTHNVSVASLWGQVHFPSPESRGSYLKLQSNLLLLINNYFKMPVVLNTKILASFFFNYFDFTGKDGRDYWFYKSLLYKDLLVTWKK